MNAEQKLIREILEELARARSKFPGDNVTTLAMVEEVGELAKATFEESADAVRKEAIQTAVMAMRIVLDGDATLRFWRALRHLDPLVAGDMPDGVTLIALERTRQISEEGWTPEHDDMHEAGEMAQAAGLYAFYAHSDEAVAHAVSLRRSFLCPPGWPFAPEWWKPKDRISNLIRAGALIAAEIDRLHRLEDPEGAQ